MRTPALSLIAAILAGCTLAAPLAAPGVAVAARGNPPGQSGAVAQDTGLGRVYVAQPVSATVLVLATRGMQLQTILKVPPAPSALAVDPTHHRLYVASDPAGTVSVFDDRSGRLLRRATIGGHPGGLALTGGGHALIVTDTVSGAVLRMPVLPALGAPAQVLSIGPDGTQNVLLAPQSTWARHQTLLWARGFQPDEPVDIYWGIHLLKRAAADRAGVVISRITIPAGAGTGPNLVIVMGQWSAHSDSTILRVVRTPPASKRKPASPKPHGGTLDVLHRLLAPHLVLTLPAVPAVGPLKSVSRIHVRPTLPAFPFLVVVLLASSILLARSGRARRRRPKREPKRPKGAPPRVAKKSPRPARAASS